MNYRMVLRERFGEARVGADRSLEATAGVQVREVQGWTGC